MSVTEDYLSLAGAVLPPERLLTGDRMASYHANCLALERRIIAVAKAASEEEIKALLKISQQLKLAVYTISTGHNWGYGTSLPVTDDCVILDLSLMNAIRDFDEELGLITLEPGVTQGQLYDYLTSRNLNFYTPVTGAGPLTSVVGNALEHGFGLAPVEDHFKAVTSVRAILADGSLYQSLPKALGAQHAGVWKWGIGPYLDGLFAQSNIGIVTALQIALAPKAEHTELFIYDPGKVNAVNRLFDAGAALLNQLGGVVNGIKILNKDYGKLMEDAATPSEIGSNSPWLAFGVFRCPSAMAPHVRRHIKQTLRQRRMRVLFFTDRKIHWVSSIVAKLPAFIRALVSNRIEQVRYILDLVQGIPRPNALRQLYQFIPAPSDLALDPIQQGVGVIWYAPIVPMKQKLVHDISEMTMQTMSRHGFTPAVSFTAIDAKCLIGVIPIIYKKGEQAQQAHACYKELSELGMEMGCPVYRMNIETLSSGANVDQTPWDLASTIKQAVDPHHILSPGRYIPIR